MTNTLRWHLLAIDPALEASLRPSALWARIAQSRSPPGKTR